jgi:SAM-dependent methyltransferase
MDERSREIKKFWDTRAEMYGADWQATLGEKYLRLLEINTMKKLIKRHAPKRVLDVGCGNGFSTKIYAEKFPSIKFFGMDYSEAMIQHAKRTPILNCSFFVGDVLDEASSKEGEFDFIMTQRCLQNLPDYECQHKAINNLLKRKSPNGYLFLMECSKDGVAQFNQLRVRIGKKPVDNLEPWHNNFFVDKSLRKDFGAEIVYFSSTYMFLAKVMFSKLSKLGYLLPPIGKFGYDRLYIIK